MSELRVIAIDGVRETIPVVVDPAVRLEAVLALRRGSVKVRCRNPKCGVVVEAGERCGSCGHSLDKTEVVHYCLDNAHA